MRAWELLKKLHADERGAEGLEKLLIIAAIVLPLLGLLIWFSKDVMKWVMDAWNAAKGDPPGSPSDPGTPNLFG
jgi:hypothetical protein